jgi:uncharacterized protein (TIGR03089 family)
MHTPTFAGALADQLRTDPARPLVTFYDDATGERVELSVTTYANWVAKTAGLLQDELDVERGSLVVVDLPTHWLGAVWLGAAWSIGARVTDDGGRLPEAALAVCGPAGVGALAAAAGRTPVVALSLRPLGARFAEPLPDGVTDYGAVVLGQPDVFVALEPPAGEDVAWEDASSSLTQEQLLVGTAGHPVMSAGGRLLTDRNPCSASGLGTLVAPLVAGGGTVWVRNPDESGWSRRVHSERATVELRAAAG